MDISGLSSVTTAAEMVTWLTENCVTPIRPAMSGADFSAIMQKMLNVSNQGDGGLVLFDVKTASYTLALSDWAIDMNVTSANVVTVPPNSVAAFPNGTKILITQSGPGQTTLVPGEGVTINAPDGKMSLRTQFSLVTLIKRATDVWFLSGDTATTPVPVKKIAKVNLTDSEHEATTAGWNNNLNRSALGTPLSLLTTDGSGAEWSIVAHEGTVNTLIFEVLPNFPFDNQDFPNDVLNTLWYIQNGTNFNFVISGLDAAKTYTIKTCAADNGTGDGQTKVTVGGNSQVGASPDGIAVELVFTGITSDSAGNLLIVIDNTAGAEYPLLNALIITED